VIGYRQHHPDGEVVEAYGLTNLPSLRQFMARVSAHAEIQAAKLARDRQARQCQPATRSVGGPCKRPPVRTSEAAVL